MERRYVMMNGDDGRLPSFKTEPGHPAFLEIPMEKLDDACAWLEAHRGGLRAGLDEYGAIYLRGLPVRSAEDFARVRDAVITERAQYRENATPRSHFGADVYSSTDLPPAQSIRPGRRGDSASTRGAAAATTIPIGTLTKTPTATTRRWSAPRRAPGPSRRRRRPLPRRR